MRRRTPIDRTNSGFLRGRIDDAHDVRAGDPVAGALRHVDPRHRILVCCDVAMAGVLRRCAIVLAGLDHSRALLLVCVFVGGKCSRRNSCAANSCQTCDGNAQKCVGLFHLVDSSFVEEQLREHLRTKLLWLDRDFPSVATIRSMPRHRVATRLVLQPPCQDMETKKANKKQRFYASGRSIQPITAATPTASCGSATCGGSVAGKMRRRFRYAVLFHRETQAGVCVYQPGCTARRNAVGCFLMSLKIFIRVLYVGDDRSCLAESRRLLDHIGC